LLGLPVQVRLNRPGASAVIYGGVEAEAVSYEGVAHALSEPGVDLRLFGKPQSYAKRRMGVALATADNTQVARDKAGRAASRVKVRA